MKYFHLLLGIVLTLFTLTTSARVELKSSDTGDLLINNTKAQLTKSVYDANGQAINEFEVIQYSDTYAHVLATLDNEKFYMKLTPNGDYSNVNEIDEIPILYNENGEIGTYYRSFIPVSAVVYVIEIKKNDASYYDGFDSNVLAFRYGQERFEGCRWDSDNDSYGDCTIGIAIEKDNELANKIITFISEIQTPLSIY